MLRDKRGRPLSFDWLTSVGLGLIDGYRRISALGNNPDIGTGSAPEDVWTVGGIYPWMSSATSLEIISTSADDASAGSGARTITINGLDASYVEISETATLNGTNAVALSTQFFRINSALVASAGSGKTNAGVVTIRDVGGGTARAQLPIGVGITRQSIYTVPSGHTLSIASIFSCIHRSGGVAKNATLGTYIQSPSGFYRIPLEIGASTTPYRHDGLPGIPLAEKTDFCLRVTSASSENTDLTAAWLGVLVNNNRL